MMENNGLRRKFSQQEVNQLGRELMEAKVEVLLRWKFTLEEISNILGVDESVTRRIVQRITDKQEDQA